ncbi:TolC family protein [Deinococcus roseus]|uniref:Transporter n=1 Tax=Deinococcus roseus TaxID=392414 RepID=A0ABQ2DB20_9DEIO|nr:TolC family protein [Deinococcus roseus]GGJ51888.1 transporter [Deinococcus roseus]
MRFARPIPLLLTLGLMQAHAAPFSLGEALKQLPTTAVWQNLNLAAEKAHQNLKAAQAATQWTVNASGNYSLNTSDFSSLNQSGSVGVSASAAVLPWASAFQTISTSEQNLTQTLLEVQTQQNTLLMKATQGYFTLALNQLKIEVARKNQILLEAQLAVSEQQRTQGTTSAESLLQARQKALEARAAVLTAESNLNLAREELLTSTGMAFPDGEYSTDTTLNVQTHSLQQWQTLALQNRNDLQKAALAVTQAQQNLQQAQQNKKLPDVTLNTTASYSDLSVGAGLNLKTGVGSLQSSYSFGSNSSGGVKFSLSASIPLLDPASEASLGTLALNVKSAQNALDTAINNATLEIKQRYAQLENTTAQVQNNQMALSLAEEHLKGVQARVKAGLSTALDEQSAQLSLDNARLNLKTSQSSLTSAQLELLISAGQTLEGVTP